MQLVPLVSYEGGRRVVVGTAVVKGDGSIQATIDPGERGARLVKMLSDFGEISINQKFDDPSTTLR